MKVLAGGDPRIISYDGVATTRIPLGPALFNLAVRSILKHARDVDLIQTFTYYAALPSLIAGRIAGKPVVVYVLGIYGEAWNQVRAPFEARLRITWEKFLMRRHYAQIVVPSSSTRDLAISLGADPRRLTVSNPGIGSEYKPGTKEEFVFFSGKADRRKGTEDLLHVARALPHVRFRAMVWGPERDSLRAAAPPNIEFPEFERGEVLRRQFAAARIFLFPSVSETFSIALTESMASGCAVVGSTVASTDLPFAGVTVLPGDHAAMVAGIDKLWKDPALCAAAGAANVNAASGFGWDAYIQRLHAIYQRVLTSSGGSLQSASEVRVA